MKYKAGFPKITITALALAAFFLGVVSLAATEASTGTKKKKILIAWSKGGGCHISMRDALTAFFQKDYGIKSFSPLSDVLYTLDPVRSLTFRYADGEDFYNFLLSHNKNTTVNLLVQTGRSMFTQKRQRIEDLLEAYVRKENPDLIISVMPMFNSSLVRAAERLHIPFLLIIPDMLDRCLTLDNYFPYYTPQAGSFYSTVPFYDETWEKSCRAEFLKSIRILGFPLRPGFFEPKDPVATRKQFDIPSDKPAIMMLLGGAGSLQQLKYLRHLMALKTPSHFIICIGRNTRIKKHILKLKMPKHLTYSIIGYTKQIADLMSVADVLICKSGPSTLFEAIEMRLPFVIDASKPLIIETPMTETIKRYQLGEMVSSLKQLEPTVSKLLNDKSRRMAIKEHMKKFSNRDYFKKLKVLIEEMTGSGVKAPERA